jgi:hypothetical protein
MNLRKIFDFPSKEQEAKINADMETILENCSNIASKERADMRQDQDMHDCICPNCRAKKSDGIENIVNKIRQVQGKGNVGGNFLGVSGSMQINTYAVNHCNKCGHEWEKFKTKPISQTHILRVCLNYLAAIIEDPIQKEFDWKIEGVRNAFGDCHAESIFRFSQKESSYLNYNATKFISLSNLRSHYPSVYDTEINEKLEKI